MCYIIVSIINVDIGFYFCSVINTFGSDIKYFNLFVYLDFGSGGSGLGINRFWYIL